MVENKLIGQKEKLSTVPILQRCICCMSKGNFSLKIAYSVCSTKETHKKFYCESCILRLGKKKCIEKGMRKYWEDICQRINANIDSIEVASHPSHKVQTRRNRILDIIRCSPGKDINELAEIYSLKYSSPIKNYLLRSDLVFLYERSFIKRHKEKLYKYSIQ